MPDKAILLKIGDYLISSDDADALAEEGRRVRSFIASNRSGTLLRLFDFLLEQSIEGRCPKETEIAEEIFQNNSNEPGRQGSRVRVGIYRLRKKLDLFYHGKSGARLTIRQGEYGFQLETPDVTAESDQTPVRKSGDSSTSAPVVRIAISILLLFNLVFSFLYFSHAFPSGNSLNHSTLWQSFDGEKNYTLVLGDYFMFLTQRNQDGVEEVVQDLSIDSADAFYEYVTTTSGIQDTLKNEDLYAVSSDILGPISRLSSYLKNIDIHPLTSSELDPTMLKSSGIIYLGALDAISPLLSNPLFEASQFRCGTTCYEIIDKASKRKFLSDSPYLLGNGIIPRRDYGYIASYPGPSGKPILILSGTGDAGVAQMVNIATNAKMLEQLRHSIGGNFRSFEALYQVRTMFNQSYGSKLLIARPIDSQRIWDEAKRSE
ncbi:hypothetical protein [Rhizorhapis sp. SPR117]|uniref:hypothetical protein n=1 Tax=Rhizorhapis sp. SPR117 TaxID=2912611 RepID=UPI001F15B67D|nr:hypothetical protein [Rhizorhapis sp. SPR117]